MTAVAGARSVHSQRALLQGAIDYAGLFPPSSLGMADAARNYLEYALSADAWALGRFVIPVARLDELYDVAREMTGADRLTWRLSAVTGVTPSSDALQLQAFVARAGASWSVDAVEARGATISAIEDLRPLITQNRRLYVELSLSDDFDLLAHHVSAFGASVKIRTGGVVAGAFPTPARLAAAMVACARIPVPFKATAGLHHPVRGEYPLTYALDSVAGTMFGYLNLLLAAVLARRGGNEAEVAQLLEERDRAAFALADDVLRWRAEVFGLEEVRIARSEFVHGFGSCSFREPLDEFSSVGT